MDIRELARRHHTHSAHKADAPQATAETAGVESAAPAAASGEGSADAATTHHVSGGGRFMHFLQAFEDRHPEETKRILNGIADKLRADAQHAGPWAARLERWADKVQKAADTGDMSNLLPMRGSHSHFGVGAYQKAQESSEAGALEQVAAAAQGAVSTAPAAESSATTAPAVQSSASVAPVATETAATTSIETNAVHEGTPIIPSTPAATSGSADATTPIISGQPSAQAETKA